MADMEARKAQALAGMQARQAEREKLKQAVSLEQDATKLFVAWFAASKQKVIELITQAASLEGVDSLNAHFLFISAELDSMQQRTAEAATFLPSHDLAQSKLAIAELHKSLQNAKASVLPRPKFGFKSRNRVPPSGDQKPPQESKSTVGTNTGNAVATLERLVAEAPVIEITQLDNQVVYKGPKSLDGSDVMLSRLAGCTISLADSSGALRAHQLQNCKIFSGPVSGSFFVEDARDCVFVIAARQARIHKAVNCDFYIGVMSQPIIEHCSGCRFGPYSLEYPELSQQIEEAGINPIYSNQMWKQVQDFNWLKADASPNWSLGLGSTKFVPMAVPSE